MYYRSSRCYPYGGYPYHCGYPYHGGYPYYGYPPYGYGYPYYGYGSNLTPIYDSPLYLNPYLPPAPPTPLQIAYATNYGA